MNDNLDAKIGCGFLLLGGFVCMVMCAGCATVGEMTYGTGYRDCVPQKLSEKGFIFKTWEGEAALSGAKATQEGAVANLWEYTVDDAEMRRQLEALPASTSARLHYRQVWSKTPWHGSTGYRITKIERMAEK